jgi:hypothetical protein
MKSALKIRLLLILFIAAASVQAQTYRLELGYNNPVRVGLGVSSTYYNGIKLGVTAEYDLKNNFSLLTGALYNLVYSNKVQKYPDYVLVTYETFGQSINIPIHAKYSYPLSKTLNVFAFGGPTVNVGLFQNSKITSTQTYEPSHPLYVLPGKFDLYNSQLNRINLQIGLGGGVQWKKYQIKGGYDIGLNNLNKAVGSPSLFQNGWYVSLSYNF